MSLGKPCVSPKSESLDSLLSRIVAFSREGAGCIEKCDIRSWSSQRVPVSPRNYSVTRAGPVPSLSPGSSPVKWRQ